MNKLLLGVTGVLSLAVTFLFYKVYQQPGNEKAEEKKEKTESKTKTNPVVSTKDIKKKRDKAVDFLLKNKYFYLLLLIWFSLLLNLFFASFKLGL